MLAPIRKSVIAAALSAAVVAQVDARSVTVSEHAVNSARAMDAAAAVQAIQAEHATALKYEKKVNLLAAALAKEVRNMGEAQKEISSAQSDLAALKHVKAEMEAK